MEDFLQKKFLSNTVESYLYVAGAILVALLVRRLISRYLAGWLIGAIIHRKASFKKNEFLRFVIKPIEDFLLAFIAFTALDRLNFPYVFRFTIFHSNSGEVTNAIGCIIVVCFFIRLCIRLLDFFGLILQERTSENISGNQLIIFFKDFFKVILVILGFLLVFRFAFNKSIGNLFTGLSIVGAALALATRESLENLIASFIIFFDKPFMTGDLVKVQGFTGTIERIGLRSTRIRTESKTYISVPNKQMVDSIVDNITLRTQRRAEMHLELGLTTTTQQLKELTASIRHILQQIPSIENFYVYLADTGKNAHIVNIEYFTAMPQAINDFNTLREEVNLQVITLLEKNEIELAAANMDVVITAK